VLNEAIGGLLPAAIAVALSPIPIAAVVLVLAEARSRMTGPAFALGWVMGLTAVSVVVVLATSGGDEPDGAVAQGIDWGLAAIGVLFLAMAVKLWVQRPRAGEEPKTPAWMASIDAISPGRALVLGAALSGANPKNLALTAAAAASISQAGLDRADTAAAIAVFVVLGSVTVIGAVVASLAAPRAVERPLAVVKQFMLDNNATIMMVILVVLGAKFLGDALAHSSA
jgi:threonine/homoserine/homoserine lactone efflux protein